MLSVRKQSDGEKGLQEQARVLGCNCAAVMLLFFYVTNLALSCMLFELDGAGGGAAAVISLIGPRADCQSQHACCPLCRPLAQRRSCKS